MKSQPSLGKSKIRILLADDHLVVREGLKALVGRQRDMQVIGEATNGRQTLHQFLRIRPDILLLDMGMPGTDGPEVIQSIVSRVAGAKVIALSMHGGDEDIYRALKAGAKAVLLKDTRRDQILGSIRSVYRGQPSISPEVGARLAARMTAPELTRREINVLELMVAGRSNKEIGTLLGISDGTAKVYTGRIFKKLGAHGRTEAIRLALESGVVHLDMPQTSNK